MGREREDAEREDFEIARSVGRRQAFVEVEVPVRDTTVFPTSPSFWESRKKRSV